MLNESGVGAQFDAEATEKLVALWASKFQLHKKDYALLHRSAANPRQPRLTAGASRSAVTASSPAHQAEYWFFIENSQAVGSFLWLCGIFDLDVDRVRTAVQPLWRELYGKH